MNDQRSAASAAHPPYVNGQRDNMAWAKRIMYREQHKCSYLMPIQVQFAKQALGLDEKPKS